MDKLSFGAFNGHFKPNITAFDWLQCRFGQSAVPILMIRFVGSFRLWAFGWILWED